MNVAAATRLALLTDGAAMSMRDSAAAMAVVEWGWLAAGVPTMVVARWASPPESRDRLLSEFHSRLRDGESITSAWAAAQHLLQTMPETSAPVHWAGWMLLGGAR